MYDFPVYDCLQEQNFSPYFSSIVRKSNSRLCQERLLTSTNLATMVNWRYTSPLYWDPVTKAPLWIEAIADTFSALSRPYRYSHFHWVWWHSVEAGERFYGVLSTDRKLSFYCFLKLLVLFCLTFAAKSISLVAETPAPRWIKLGYKYWACGSIAVKGGTIVDLRAQFYKALVSIYSEKWPGLCHKELL